MSIPLRLALFYVAVFGANGIQLPYWPVWLNARGLDPAEIGAVLASVLWVKVFTNPVAGWLADTTGARRRVMLGFAGAALVAFLLFGPARGFWPIFAVSLVSGACFSALMPLGDNLTVLASYRHGFDYGRVRLWGSVSFILAALLGGQVLTDGAPERVLLLMIGGVAATLASCALLPAGTGEARPGRRSWRLLLADRRPAIFFGAATLIQASHSVYYAFGTLHWRAIGHSALAIGALWAEGVVAEIVLFLLGARLVDRLGPGGLLVLGGAAGALRWTLTAFAEALPLLAALQLLHAFTFGAAHLGAMHFIARAIPAELSATAQALYSASVAGLGFGIAMALSGALYAAFGGGAYLAMAGLAALGGATSLVLVRRHRGGAAVTAGPP